MTDQILQKVDAGEELAPKEIQTLLEISNADALQALYNCAYRMKAREVGKVAYFRGIIECSNLCVKNCQQNWILKSLPVLAPLFLALSSRTKRRNFAIPIKVCVHLKRVMPTTFSGVMIW